MFFEVKAYVYSNSSTVSLANQNVFNRLEAAIYLRVSPSTIDRWVKSGAIKTGKVNRRVLFHRDALDAVAKSQPAS